LDIDTLISQLHATHAGSRKLDSSIAFALGWKLQSDTIVDPETGQHSKRHLWFKPNSREIAPVPFWTTNLTDAHKLAEEVAPKLVIGFSFEPGKGSAKIGSGPYVQAVSAPVALCIAALAHRKESLSV
jgi:hypothetical protein